MAIAYQQQLPVDGNRILDDNRIELTPEFEKIPVGVFEFYYLK